MAISIFIYCLGIAEDALTRAGWGFLPVENSDFLN